MNDLLKVLDLTEEEQKDWLWNNKLIHEDESLADLAFRLRDEAVKLSPVCFQKARAKIYYQVYYYPIGERVLQSKNFLCTAEWWLEEAQPIHWIIAALIAKELSKDKDNG